MDFLGKTPKGKPPPCVVVFGDDEFLRREGRLRVRQWVLGPEPDEFALTTYAGDACDYRTLHDELFTQPFTGDCRFVIVEDADKFVTTYRKQLERLVQAPSAVGVLLLDVRTWTSTTLLAKAVESQGLALEANSPKIQHTPSWCVKWAQSRHQKKITREAAEWLVDLVGAHLGLLDQELAKLATFVGARPEIERKDVDRLVAGTRAETGFLLLESAMSGQLARTMEMLDRQLATGESPDGIYYMVAWQLRRLTQVARRIVAGLNPAAAMQEAGVASFATGITMDQLRHLGRPRMLLMYRRILQTELDLKGGSCLPPRTVLERLLVDLAVKSNP